jgi:hypothetical protein
MGEKVEHLKSGTTLQPDTNLTQIERVLEAGGPSNTVQGALDLGVSTTKWNPPPQILEASSANPS